MRILRILITMNKQYVYIAFRRVIIDIVLSITITASGELQSKFSLKRRKFGSN